jgi:hypothetical protein
MGDIPPRPIPRPHELQSGTPFLLSRQTKYSIGWQAWPNNKGGTQYVTTRWSVGLHRILHKYPLTD